MSHLNKWKSFFNRKQWKYKEFKGPYDSGIMCVIGRKNDKCNIFISDRKVTFKYYKRRANRKDYDSKNSIKITFVIKNKLLSVYKKDKKFFQNLGFRASQEIEDSQLNMSKKIKPILNFYFGLNKLKQYPSLRQTIKCLQYPGIVKLEGIHLHKSFISILRQKDLTSDQLIKKIIGHNSKIIKKELYDKEKHVAQVLYILKPFLNRGEAEQISLSGCSDILGNSRVKNTKKVFRRFFRKLTSKQIVHLFTQVYNPFYVEDTIRQVMEHEDKIVLPKQLKNWKYLHDEISNQYRKLKNQDYEFKLTDKLKKIDNHKIENEVIVVPKTRHELIDWGQKMNNCIAGYHQEFNQGRTVLLAVKENNELKYNIEIQNRNIRQFMLNRNVRAPEEVIKKYTEIFKSYGLVS